MRSEYIAKGSIINTIFGEIEITGYNGSIAYCVEREYDESGEICREEEGRYTLNEIGHLMKEVDGRNHRVRYEEEGEDEQ